MRLTKQQLSALEAIAFGGWTLQADLRSYALCKGVETKHLRLTTIDPLWNEGLVTKNGCTSPDMKLTEAGYRALAASKSFEKRVYEAQAREDARAAIAGRKPRCIASVDEITDETGKDLS